jgi:hypothetical protein
MADFRPSSVRNSVDQLTLNLFARFDTLAFALASACVAALIMFLATASLLVIGPAAGRPLGTHLSAFATFWPGYSVSWVGALVGTIYAGLIGGLIGFALAVFWNFCHIVIVGLAALRLGVDECDPC